MEAHIAVAKRRPRRHLQYAALPFRAASDGTIQVLLITSRETGRWVIPKGWPMRGKKPREVAAQEAFEEAGLQGANVGRRAAGSFHYTKLLANGEGVLCEVRVYLLLVERELDRFPEHGQRQARWCPAAEAAALVDEGGLAEIIRRSVDATFFRPHRKTK